VEVVAGTVNQDGSLRIKITKTGEETTLAGIMRLVDEAQKSKSRTQLLADPRWLAGCSTWHSASRRLRPSRGSSPRGSTSVSRTRSHSSRHRACPHALGLAVPLVVAINTSTAAQNGMLIRDRIAMEEARNLDTVIFDKTGTLTKGEQGVVGVETADDWSEERAFEVAAGVEGDSEHMIARAIRDAAAEERDVQRASVSNFENFRGLGVRATVDGETVHIGGPNLIEKLGIERSDGIAAFAGKPVRTQRRSSIWFTTNPKSSQHSRSRTLSGTKVGRLSRRYTRWTSRWRC